MLTSTKTFQEETGDGSTKIFNFNIPVLENDINNVIKIFIDRILQAPSTYTLSEDAATDGIAPGGSVEFNNAPTSGDTILIQRETARTQETDFPADYDSSVSERQANREVMISQEIDDQGVGSRIPDYIVGESYKKNQVIRVRDQGAQFDDSLFRATRDFTAVSFITEFGNGDWEEILLKGEKGDTGGQGPKGNKGDKGDQGNAGPTGPAGSDGIFSQIATEAEAEAGSDNTKGMTPLRVNDALTTNVKDLPVINTLQSDVSNLQTKNTELESRVNILEGTSSLVRARGEQRARNNITTPIELDASAGENGKGNKFQLDGDGARSARIEVEIYREDDAEKRFVVVTFKAYFSGGIWFIGRDSTVILDGSLPDGLTFSIVNKPGKVGTVAYTSDDMAGGNYRNGSYIRWFIEEISKNF